MNVLYLSEVAEHLRSLFSMIPHTVSGWDRPHTQLRLCLHVCNILGFHPQFPQWLDCHSSCLLFYLYSMLHFLEPRTYFHGSTDLQTDKPPTAHLTSRLLRCICGLLIWIRKTLIWPSTVHVTVTVVVFSPCKVLMVYRTPNLILHVLNSMHLVQ